MQAMPAMQGFQGQGAHSGSAGVGGGFGGMGGGMVGGMGGSMGGGIGGGTGMRMGMQQQQPQQHQQQQQQSGAGNILSKLENDFFATQQTAQPSQGSHTIGQRINAVPTQSLDHFAFLAQK